MQLYIQRFPARNATLERQQQCTQFPRNTQKSNALHSSLSYPMRIAFLSAVASVKQYQPERRRSALCGLRNVGVAVAAAALLLSNTDAAHAYGLTRAGRLDKCHGDEACVSTSSVGNPVKFGPPWTYEPQTSDATEAWATLKNAVLQNKDKGKIIEAIDGPEIYYMRAEYPSFAGGTDDVEFRLLPRDHLVTYRSASRKAIFVYPLQTPINTGRNLSRLAEIRGVLGWSELDGNIMTSASTTASPSPDFIPDSQ